MKLKAKDLQEFQLLINFLVNIGTLYGGLHKYFKEEKLAERVNQPLNHIDFDDENRDINDYGLRLYCTKITDKVVILFSGARKTVKGNAEQCENCRPYFEMANKLAHAIENAFIKGQLFIENEFTIQSEEEFELNI